MRSFFFFYSYVVLNFVDIPEVIEQVLINGHFDYFHSCVIKTYATANSLKLLYTTETQKVQGRSQRGKFAKGVF